MRTARFAILATTALMAISLAVSPAEAQVQVPVSCEAQGPLSQTGSQLNWRGTALCTDPVYTGIYAVPFSATGSLVGRRCLTDIGGTWDAILRQQPTSSYFAPVRSSLSVVFAAQTGAMRITGGPDYDVAAGSGVMTTTCETPEYASAKYTLWYVGSLGE